jgi:hypothetical protein
VSITDVVVFFTRNLGKLGLHFYDFPTILKRIYKILQIGNTIEVSFCTGTPSGFSFFTVMPLDYSKHPTKRSGLATRPLAMGGGGAGQILASRPRSRPGKRWGTTVGSPRAWGWPAWTRGGD